MKQIQIIKQHAGTLRLGYLGNNVQSLLHQASIDSPGYMEFLLSVLEKEIGQRQQTTISDE